MARFLAVAGLCLTSFTALLTPGLSAQADSVPIVVSGTVVDPMHKPVEGAEIRVPGTTSSTLTPADGTFRLSARMKGVLLVQVRRPGYNAQILRVTDHWSGTVLLVPGAFELPEIQITARYAKPAKYAGTAKYDDFFRRRRQGFGTFIDRDEIDRRGATPSRPLPDLASPGRARTNALSVYGRKPGPWSVLSSIESLPAISN